MSILYLYRQNTNMGKKINNNLIRISIDNRHYYFTSQNNAGRFLNLSVESIKSAINNNTVLVTNDDERVTFSIIDGSEIPYKYINN